MILGVAFGLNWSSRKVIQMIGDLEGKIIGEGKDAQKVYDEYSEFCEDRSKALGFEIKTGKAEKKLGCFQCYTPTLV